MKPSLVALALSAVLTTSLLTVAPGAATGGLPADYAAFPACSEVTNTWCEVSFQIDYNGDGTYEDPNPTDDVRADVYLFGQSYGYPAMTWDVRRDGMRQELAPNLPEGTAVKIVINTGDWRPPTKSFSMWHTIGFQSQQTDAGWVTTFEAKTQHWNFALGCSTEDCSDPTSQMEYTSFGQGILYGDPANASDLAEAGFWVSSNATSTQQPWYDPKTMTWHVETAGPSYTSTSELNIASLYAFIPDSMALTTYQIDPLAIGSGMAVTRTDGSSTVTLDATIEHVSSPAPGILISVPAITYVSATPPTPVAGMQFAPTFQPIVTTTKYRSPKIVIKQKKSNLASRYISKTRVVGKSVTLSYAKVTGARSYKASCTKNKTVRRTTSSSTSAKISGLYKGTWHCRVLVTTKTSASLSNPVNVVIR